MQLRKIWCSAREMEKPNGVLNLIFVKGGSAARFVAQQKEESLEKLLSAFIITNSLCCGQTDRTALPSAIDDDDDYWQSISEKPQIVKVDWLTVIPLLLLEYKLK